MKRFVLSIVLLSGTTTAFGQSLPEPEESGISYGICSVADNLDDLLKVSVQVEALHDANLYEEVMFIFRELALLCRDRPTDGTIRNGAAKIWLIRADSVNEQLSYVALQAVLHDPEENPDTFRLSDRLALFTHNLNVRLNAVRTLAYDAVKTETVEVVREVPAPCEDASDACDDLLRPAIARWAKSLGELTDNHDRANEAMREAVRIKREARAVGPSSVGLGALVNDWATRLGEQLALPDNYIREYFGLTDREERILSRLMMDMRSEVALCLR